MCYETTRAVRQVWKGPLIVKLTPNVADITSIAKAAVEAGADALSLINTLVGMAIDIHTMRPVLGNVTGGLSGPAIKPVALRCVWQVSQAVSVPVIGMGGISSAEDALEFIMAGASAVAVGTGLLTNPEIPRKITTGIQEFCQAKGIPALKEIVGGAWRQKLIYLVTDLNNDCLCACVGHKTRGLPPGFLIAPASTQSTSTLPDEAASECAAAKVAAHLRASWVISRPGAGLNSTWAPFTPLAWSQISPASVSDVPGSHCLPNLSPHMQLFPRGLGGFQRSWPFSGKPVWHHRR